MRTIVENEPDFAEFCEQAGSPQPQLSSAVMKHACVFTPTCRKW
jgi:hypothetical protein